MAFVQIEPEHRDLLRRAGLVTPTDFLRLQGVIVCGHPDRHVAEVVLSAGDEPLRTFLKREHRVRWRDRLASAWAGFGFVSKSVREFQLLRALRRAGVGCPEALAAGEDGQGRAFLLMREVPNGVDLRLFLKECCTSPRQRRALARQLGTALARLHAAGFDHPDLYSKHVLVSVAADKDSPVFHFLDWQRSRLRARLCWSRCWRGLAALDATLDDKLAGLRERLACLRAYLLARRASEGGTKPSVARRASSQRIRRISLALQRRRHVRELRQPPLRPGTQSLIWLDGEALCVTGAFREEIRDDIPDELRLPQYAEAGGNRVDQREITLPGPRRGTLIRRSLSRPLLWLWTWLRRRTLPSPELELAAALFRLQRYGVVTPRLLAVGQRYARPWRTESFLLTEPRPAATLRDWLAAHPDRRERWRLLRQAGEVLRRTHQAGYSFGPVARGSLGNLLLLDPLATRPTVVLGGTELLRKRPPWASVVNELAELWRIFAPLCTWPEALRFLLAYLDVPQLTAPARRLARLVAARAPRRVMA